MFLCKTWSHVLNTFGCAQPPGLGSGCPKLEWHVYQGYSLPGYRVPGRYFLSRGALILYRRNHGNNLQSVLRSLDDWQYRYVYSRDNVWTVWLDKLLITRGKGPYGIAKVKKEKTNVNVWKVMINKHFAALALCVILFCLTFTTLFWQ